MSPRYLQYLPLLAVVLTPAFSHAQSVSSGPLSALPVNSSWMIIALILGLAAVAWWSFRRAGARSLHSALAPLVIVVGAGWLTVSTELGAQLLVQFTDPKGETLFLPYSEGEDEYFEVTNSAGVSLRITNIEPPESCGIILLPPGKPDIATSDAAPAEKSAAPADCEVGSVLAVSESCVIDFSFCGVIEE